MKKVFLLFALLFVCLGVSAQDAPVVVASPKSDSIVGRVRVGPNTVTVRVIRNGKVVFEEVNHNLKTNAGVDWLANVMSATSSAPTQANYIGLTADATAPAVTDTVLASEITNNGLSRAQATYAHTNGTTTYTLTKTWTCNTGAVSNVQKAGVFTAISSGTMVFEFQWATPITLNPNDQIQLIWTVSIS